MSLGGAAALLGSGNVKPPAETGPSRPSAPARPVRRTSPTTPARTARRQRGLRSLGVVRAVLEVADLGARAGELACLGVAEPRHG